MTITHISQLNEKQKASLMQSKELLEQRIGLHVRLCGPIYTQFHAFTLRFVIEDEKGVGIYYAKIATE